MWSVMQISARFQSAFDRLRHDAVELSRDLGHYFDTMSAETRILFFLMFILTIFYMIVRRPNDAKESGGMARQFVYALAIIVIFGMGIGWAMDHSQTQITRI